MQKIIIPFDGTHFSVGAVTFAKYLSGLKPIFLSGFFLPDYSKMFWYAGIESFAVPSMMLVPAQEDDDNLYTSIGQFREFCRENSIEYTIHKGNEDYSLHQLKRESRFSDLIILSSEQFFPENGTSESSLTDILEEVECPVLLLPEAYEIPENIILAYDGSQSSVQAIKKFTYLFPELCNIKTTLIYADRGIGNGIPNFEYIKEWASHHFSDLTFSSLDADPEMYFETWMMEIRAPLLVSGAYNRSAFSRLFKRSFALNFIRDYKIPLFISHT